MGNIIAIYQKELQGYFASPLAYAIAGIFWLLCGVFFLLVLHL
jgi:ABC-2 type transport system permease protein